MDCNIRQKPTLMIWGPSTTDHAQWVREIAPSHGRTYQRTLMQRPQTASGLSQQYFAIGLGETTGLECWRSLTLFQTRPLISYRAGRGIHPVRTVWNSGSIRPNTTLNRSAAIWFFIYIIAFRDNWGQSQVGCAPRTFHGALLCHGVNLYGSHTRCIWML